MPSQQKLNLCPSPLIKFNYLEGLKKKKHWDRSGSLLLGPIPSPDLTECKLLEDQYCSGTRWSPGWAYGTPCSAPQQSEADCSAEPWLLPELITEGSWAQACLWIIQEIGGFQSKERYKSVTLSRGTQSPGERSLQALCSLCMGIKKIKKEFIMPSPSVSFNSYVDNFPPSKVRCRKQEHSVCWLQQQQIKS